MAGFEGDGRVEAVRARRRRGRPRRRRRAWASASTPATDWLEGSGLELDDGVVCDETLRHRGAPDVVAAGDVARWPNPLFGEVDAGRALDQRRRAGRAPRPAHLLGARRTPEPFAPVPFFWSDQYDLKIQFVGRARSDDEFAVVEGSFEEGAGVGLFGRAGRLVGALAFNRPRLLMKYRKLIAQSASWNDALALDAALR